MPRKTLSLIPKVFSSCSLAGYFSPLLIYTLSVDAQRGPSTNCLELTLVLCTDNANSSAAWASCSFFPVRMALNPSVTRTVIRAHRWGMDSSQCIRCILSGERQAGRWAWISPSLLGSFTSSLHWVEGVWGHQLFPVAIWAGHIKNIPDNSELHV